MAEGESPRTDGPDMADEEATEKDKPKRRRRSREAAPETAGAASPPDVTVPEASISSEAAVDDGEDASEVKEGEVQEASSKPAPARRRARRDPNLPAPVVRARAKYVRSSARKARLVCDHIRGKSVEEARAILAHTSRAVARDWSKLLESAVANAENNHELVGEDLYIKAVHADEGPTIKRFRPRAMGRATRIRKRTSHLTILLTPKE